MSKNEMTVRLGHPVVIFIHSVALLLIGCAIGMHWHQSHSAAIWIAVSGAVLVVINEMISCFWWVSLTAWWIRRHRHSGGS
jgi:dTDP-4-dehydrorhamnose 3,5-epimerase-like enzyme